MTLEGTGDSELQGGLTTDRKHVLIASAVLSAAAVGFVSGMFFKITGAVVAGAVTGAVLES